MFFFSFFVWLWSIVFSPPLLGAGRWKKHIFRFFSSSFLLIVSILCLNTVLLGLGGGVENRNSFQGLYETLESNESAGFEMVGARWVVQPQQNIHNCLHDVLSFISSFSGNIYFIAFLYLIIRAVTRIFKLLDWFFISVGRFRTEYRKIDSISPLYKYKYTSTTYPSL